MLVLVVLMGAIMSSCKKDKIEYQVRIQNDMSMDLLELPFMKYRIAECTLGNNLFTDVALGEYSDRVTVTSSTDYDCSLTIEIFTYNINTFDWESSGTQNFDMGSISWSDSEDYKNQKIKFQIGDLLQGYKPVYTKYAEE
jgi:hypothetical protein